MGKTDLKYLLEITDGDKEIMKEMVGLFLKETPVQIQKIRGAYEARNWEQLGAEAHKLKPTFMYVGLSDLKNMAQEIEKAGKNQKNLEAVPDLLKAIEEGYKDAAGELNEMKEQLNL